LAARGLDLIARVDPDRALSARKDAADDGRCGERKHDEHTTTHRHVSYYAETCPAKKTAKRRA
jgi:hypothetical protein